MNRLEDFKHFANTLMADLGRQQDHKLVIAVSIVDPETKMEIAHSRTIKIPEKEGTGFALRLLAALDMVLGGNEDGI